MFQGANLAAATLEDTDLNGAKFTNANLEVCLDCCLKYFDPTFTSEYN